MKITPFAIIICFLCLSGCETEKAIPGGIATATEDLSYFLDKNTDLCFAARDSMVGLYTVKSITSVLCTEKVLAEAKK